MMKDGRMTVKDVIVDTMERLGIGDDGYSNLRDVLNALAEASPEGLGIEMPNAVVTSQLGSG